MNDFGLTMSMFYFKDRVYNYYLIDSNDWSFDSKIFDDLCRIKTVIQKWSLYLDCFDLVGFRIGNL